MNSISTHDLSTVTVAAREMFVLITTNQNIFDVPVV